MNQRLFALETSTMTKAELSAALCQQLGPLVVSCGKRQSKLLVVVEPGGHVGRLPLSLSTCPRGGFQEHGIER